MPNSSIKNEGMYEDLRKEGASKEKAARISNAAAAEGEKKVSARGGRAGSYEDMTKDELYERAQKIGIDGRSSMTKDQLIDALRNH